MVRWIVVGTGRDEEREIIGGERWERRGRKELGKQEIKRKRVDIRWKGKMETETET